MYRFDILLQSCFERQKACPFRCLATLYQRRQPEPLDIDMVFLVNKVLSIEHRGPRLWIRISRSTRGRAAGSAEELDLKGSAC